MSVFYTIKNHIIHDHYYKLRMLANKALFVYIEIYYNRFGRYWGNVWMLPQQYEQQYEQQYYQNSKMIEMGTV